MDCFKECLFRAECRYVLVSQVDTFCKIVKSITVAAKFTYDPNYSFVQKGIAKGYAMPGMLVLKGFFGE